MTSFLRAYFRTLGIFGSGFLIGCAYIGLLAGLGRLQ